MLVRWGRGGKGVHTSWMVIQAMLSETGNVLGEVKALRREVAELRAALIERERAG